MTASLASRSQEKDGPSGEPWAKGKMRRNGPRVEQVWKCTKITNLYFDKQINYLHDFGGGVCAEKVLEWKKGGKYPMQILEK